MKVFIKLIKNPTSLIGIVLLVFFILVAIFAPLIAPPEARSRDPYMIPRSGFSNPPSPPDEERARHSVSAS
jgi:peptide/nickel transport system permease protein